MTVCVVLLVVCCDVVLLDSTVLDLTACRNFFGAE